jgi:galactokinase
MTGAGFGGCAIALVKREAVPSFVDAVASEYRSATNLEPKLYVCEPSDGAQIFSPDAVA